MYIGKMINELRRSKNITQDELAAELGVTAAAVSKWENGYTMPDILMLCALADFFGVSTDELLGRVKEWKYAVVAAETKALGQRIAKLAKAYGVYTREIFTDFNAAVAAAKQDDTVRYTIAGFYNGWYAADVSSTLLVSVHPTDDEILNALKWVFEKNLNDDEHRFIIN